MSSRVNEVNGENLQDPPNQKSWLRQCCYSQTLLHFPVSDTLILTHSLLIGEYITKLSKPSLRRLHSTFVYDIIKLRQHDSLL